jgi:hypothetical protein
MSRFNWVKSASPEDVAKLAEIREGTEGLVKEVKQCYRDNDEEGVRKARELLRGYEHETRAIAARYKTP